MLLSICFCRQSGLEWTAQNRNQAGYLATLQPYQQVPQRRVVRPRSMAPQFSFKWSMMFAGENSFSGSHLHRVQHCLHLHGPHQICTPGKHWKWWVSSVSVLCIHLFLVTSYLFSPGEDNPLEGLHWLLHLMCSEDTAGWDWWLPTNCRQ